MKALLTAILATVALLHGADSFSYEVFRTKLLRDEPGTLEITERGVSYRSADGKRTFMLPLQDIRGADVSVPGRITIQTYDVGPRQFGGNKELHFRLRSGTQDQRLARFLAESLSRPIVGFQQLGEDAYRLPVYHRGTLSGSHGTLLIGSAGIEFASEKPKDSRTWLYRDIQSIGTPDPFRLRVTTYEETFTFDLKERLPEAAWRRAWEKVYDLESKAIKK